MAKGKVIGIDLGTTNSVVAEVDTDDFSFRHNGPSIAEY